MFNSNTSRPGARRCVAAVLASALASRVVGSSAAMAPLELAGPAAAPLSKAEVRLSGVWSSHDTSHGASAGVLVLAKNRTAMPQPYPNQGQQFAPAIGTWHADATRIFVQSRQGNPTFTYVFLKAGTLSVRYADGGSQVFVREKDQR